MNVSANDGVDPLHVVVLENDQNRILWIDETVDVGKKLGDRRLSQPSSWRFAFLADLIRHLSNECLRYVNPIRVMSYKFGD